MGRALVAIAAILRAACVADELGAEVGPKQAFVVPRDGDLGNFPSIDDSRQLLITICTVVELCHTADLFSGEGQSMEELVEQLNEVVDVGPAPIFTMDTRGISCHAANPPSLLPHPRLSFACAQIMRFRSPRSMTAWGKIGAQRAMVLTG